ncbi:hypothetical protein BLNAU_8832 [Blattamonas nauphoetae]|uniref:Uncharacterized protein n=1 Tax=Blattamonas nauphoetae TaxID=2049346 RepID=A0ABQ9XXP4_9EUKA|nr:hypothetical protein BLNAU_8832 [Blattamonas nauphoetae]
MLRTLLVLPDPQAKFTEVMNKAPGNKEDLSTEGSWATYHHHVTIQGVELILRIQWVDNIVFVNEFTRLFPKADAFMLAFSTANRASFERANGKWMSEMQWEMHGKPFYFCGTKTDVRDSSECPDDQKVSTEEVQYVVSTLRMSHYFEVSAEKKTGIKEMFDRVGEDILMKLVCRFDSDWRMHLQRHPYKPEEKEKVKEVLDHYKEREGKERGDKLETFKNEGAKKYIEQIEETRKLQKEKEKAEGKSSSCTIF